MLGGSVSAPWLDAPLRRFVQDSRVQRAIVLRPDGNVLGQFGFQSSTEVMTACSLAAAINSSGSELARQLGGRPFLGLYQGGRSQGVFMGMCAARVQDYLLLAAFDRESTIGEFRDALSELDGKGPAGNLPKDLESDLNSSLDALFGPLS